MVKESLETVVSDLEVALTDAAKFDAGNSSAGTRLRKKVQAVSKALKAVRKVVSEVKAQRKSEKPAKVVPSETV